MEVVMECPKCGQGLKMNMELLREETISVAIKFTGDLLDAATVHKTLAAIEGSVVETARCLGAVRVAVFVSRLQLKPGQFIADLFVQCSDGEADEIVNATVELIKSAEDEQ